MTPSHPPRPPLSALPKHSSMETSSSASKHALDPPTAQAPPSKQVRCKAFPKSSQRPEQVYVAASATVEMPQPCRPCPKGPPAFLPTPPEIASMNQQLKKGVFSKGVLAEIACNVIFPLRGCAQGLHDSSARRCLVQNVGCCDSNAPQGTKILNCRIGTRRAQCRGGSAVHSALQGSAENWRPNFRHFSDIFRTPCFTVFDVQDVRNTISDNFRILPKIFRKFPHCRGPSEA